MRDPAFPGLDRHLGGDDQPGFFRELDEADQARMEDADTWTYWEDYFRPVP